MKFCAIPFFEFIDSMTSQDIDLSFLDILYTMYGKVLLIYTFVEQFLSGQNIAVRSSIRNGFCVAQDRNIT
jgi:hypothetical protein